MVLLIIIPFLNGYFIGKINPTFSDKPISMIVIIHVKIGHWGMQPSLRHTMTHPMNMVTFCLSEVRSAILTLLSSHQLHVTAFFWAQHHSKQIPTQIQPESNFRFKNTFQVAVCLRIRWVVQVRILVDFGNLQH